MCSTPESRPGQRADPRLERIGTAIDELAAEVAAAGVTGPGPLAGRLADVWAMVADLDPGMAQRLPGYSDGA
jgi:hypothetical protein